MSEIQDVVTRLETKVAAQDTVVGSVKTLLAELKQMLQEAIANGGNDPALVARVQAVVDHIDANDTSLANAVVENTPSAPTPTPEPPPVVEPTT